MARIEKTVLPDGTEEVVVIHDKDDKKTSKN